MKIISKLTVFFFLLISPQSSLAILPDGINKPILSNVTQFIVYPWNYHNSRDINQHGDVLISVGWHDKSGDNRILFSRSESEPALGQCKNSSGCHNAEIVMQHFIQDGGKLRRLRKIYDYARNCPATMDIGFLKDSITITDLDFDGTAEITFLYNIRCKENQRPIMKLIMLENNKKYALRGSNTHTIKNQTFAPDTYNIDHAYKFAPKTFLQFSKSQWNNFK